MVAVLCLVPAVAQAAQSKSPTYQVNEVFFGSGGELNSCSTGQYCSKQSAGELTVGNTKSAGYQAQGGFNTDRAPYLEVTVSDTNVNLGTLKPTTTAMASATFSVRAFLAHGYTVINASGPPTNGNYVMKSINVPTASAVGTEQFGINLVANTDPEVIGANPVDRSKTADDARYAPADVFSYGQVAPDYDTPNLYKYLQGDQIAYSDASSSYTDYTISYLFNVSNVTPGGSYVFNHIIVVTATY